MFKKLGSIILSTIIVASLTVSAFAIPEGMVRDMNSSSKKQFIIKITRPDGDESTFKKSYVVCGNTELKNIRVELYKYNDSSAGFEPFANTDGQTGWDIGSSGIFMKEVYFDKMGANKIRIAAYNKDEANSLVLDTNLQVNDFTVTVLEDSIKDKIKNGVLRVTDMLKDVFIKNY